MFQVGFGFEGKEEIVVGWTQFLKANSLTFDKPYMCARFELKEKENVVRPCSDLAMSHNLI